MNPAHITIAPLDQNPADLRALSRALEKRRLSLELESPPEPVAAEPAAGEVADNPEVATKIELAMAYEEMGDRDGARELFQEAVTEGSPAQQKVARAKLDSLG